jgi:hypothetical protein
MMVIMIMMVLGRLFGWILAPFRKMGVKNVKVSDELAQGEIAERNESIYPDATELDEIHNLWDFLDFLPNTQAFHLTKVIGFEEWVTMDEIRRRIMELFNVNYKNERSLYAYIKTMVDCGLLETTSIGGKRKWRKRDLIVKLKKKKKALETEEEKAVLPVS